MATLTPTSLNGAIQRAFLNRKALKERLAQSRPILEVPVAELAEPGGPPEYVLMQRLSGSRRRELSLLQMCETPFDDDERNERNKAGGWRDALRRNEQNRISLVAFSLVTPEGAMAFTEAEIAEIAEDNPPALDWLNAAAVMLNGFPRAGVDAHLITRWQALGIDTPAEQALGERVGKLPPITTNGSSST